MWASAVIILLIVSVPRETESNEQSCTQFTTTEGGEGKRLIGYSFVNLTLTADWDNCMLSCVLDCRCMSYNIGATAAGPVYCELNYEDSTVDEAALVSDSESQYYTIRIARDNQVSGHTPFLLLS